MKKVPLYLIAIIIFFVYDDIYVSSETWPILHYFLMFIVSIVVFAFAIGQGNLIKEGFQLLMGRLTSKAEVLNEKRKTLQSQIKEKAEQAKSKIDEEKDTQRGSEKGK